MYSLTVDIFSFQSPYFFLWKQFLQFTYFIQFWFVELGDVVAEDDVVCEIETEKVLM